MTVIRVTYCRRATVERLRTSVPENIDWYFDPARDDVLPELLASEALLEDRMEIEAFWEGLRLPTAGASDRVRSQTDRQNVLVVYRALSALTPAQAADGRLWAYLCHTHCARYVKLRWMSRRPVEADRAERTADNHFFTGSNRTFIRDNGVSRLWSRLWWIGHVAHRIEPGAEERFLEIVLHTQEIRQQVLERPSLAMSTHVLSHMYHVMREFWNSRNHADDLFARETFRLWMQNVNGRGGMVLLDAMGSEPLRQLLRDEAERALEPTT